MNVALRGLTVLVGSTALAMAVATQALATPASPSSTTVKTVHSCRQNVSAGHYTCFAAAAQRRRLHAEVEAHAAAQPPRAGYGPSSLQSAYALPSASAGSGQRVYIVDAYDDPNAESDLAAYRTQYGLPACTTANGCFQKLNQNGATSPLPDRRHRLGRRDLPRPRHGLGRLPQLRHHADRGQRRRRQPVHRGEGSHHARREVRLDELGRRRGRHRGDLRLAVLQVHRRRVHRLDR